MDGTGLRKDEFTFKVRRDAAIGDEPPEHLCGDLGSRQQLGNRERAAGRSEPIGNGPKQCRVRASGIRHLFITVIAYQLMQGIRTRLRAHGEHASWTTLRRILEGQQRVTATFRRPDRRTLHVRTATQAEPEQRAIYDALGIDPQPGGVRKTTI